MSNSGFHVRSSLSSVKHSQLITALGVLEKHILEWEDTDQMYLVKTLNKQHDKLAGAFYQFIEEQVRSIEDMKITAKKRQGILLMFKIFPVLVLPCVSDLRDLWRKLSLNSSLPL